MSFGDTSQGQVAQELGVPMAQVALACVLRKPAVGAPILGTTKTRHLSEAAAALEIQLTDGQARQLEAPYTLRLPTGH